MPGSVVPGIVVPGMVVLSLVVPGSVVPGSVVPGSVTVMVTGPAMGSEEVEDSSEDETLVSGDGGDVAADYSWNNRSFGRTILGDSNSLLWDEGSGDTRKSKRSD